MAETLTPAELEALADAARAFALTLTGTELREDYPLLGPALAKLVAAEDSDG